jgi:hypothetical protein
VDNKQTANFLKQVMGAYPTFEPTPERMEIWGRHMANIDFDLAIKRLDKHAHASKFAPSIADIVNPDEAIKRKKKTEDPDTLSPAALMQGGYITFM